MMVFNFGYLVCLDSDTNLSLMFDVTVLFSKESTIQRYMTWCLGRACAKVMIALLALRLCDWYAPGVVHFIIIHKYCQLIPNDVT